MKINENILEFLNTSPIEFQPQQIRQFELHFISDQQIAPSYTINDKLFVLIAPEILLTPQLSVPRVSLFNTNQKIKTLPAGTNLFSLQFNATSILPIMKTYDEIIQRNRLDSAVLNYGFMHNVSQLVTRVASLGLNDNPTLQNVLLAKIKTKNSKKDQSNSLPLDQVPNQIQDLNKDQADITLSTLHLLHSLLNNKFGFDK